MKLCRKCLIEKSLDDFHKCAANRDGLKSWCKTCSSENMKGYYQQNADRMKARSASPEVRQKRDAYMRSERGKAMVRAYYATPRGQEISRRSKLKSTFGLTLEAYDELLAKQDNGCGICGRSRSDDGRRLAVDHCHNTGRVRGLLCSACNLALGMFGDDIEMLKRAVVYLENT